MPTSRSTEDLSWENHVKWFKDRHNRYDFLICIIDKDKFSRPVGVIHISNLDSTIPEIGLYIYDKDLHNQGIGRGAILEVIKFLEAMNTSFAVRAIIHPENLSSISIFKACGFMYVGEGRNGQGIYECSIS